MNKAEPILQEIKKAVMEVDPTAEVVLFGSRARGDFHDESDWDVLVLTEMDETNKDFKKKIRDVLYGIELRVGQVISSVVCNKVFWSNKLNGSPLFQEVAKDGLSL